MDDTVIRVEHLSKSYKLYDKKSDRLREALSLSKKQYYKPFDALRDVSFDVKRGETLGIIGTNGSGKSTLLKILTGVVAQTSGTFEVKGKISALLELGAGFNAEYTGLQNVDLQGTMMGYTPEEIDARRDEIVRFADIGEYIKQPVKNYSSGMFARLAFAVAISVDPEILIVDEALSVGDVFFQSKCFRKFDELRERGVSILFVSHDIGAVRKMCSRVLWIERGEQQMFGECNEVCTAYFNMQIAQMNKETERNLASVEAETEIIRKDGQLAAAGPAIHPAPNSILSDKCEILSCFVKDADGRFAAEMIADKTYSIGIITRFHEALEKVIVGFSMNNAKGIICLASNTYEQTETNFAVNAGDVVETSFSFTVPRLHAGQYEISPAVALGVQENHVNLTWLYGVKSVELINDHYEIAELGLDYCITNTQITDVQLFEA